MKRMSFETLMDILDWFNDGLYDYIRHILLTTPDGEGRIRRAIGTHACSPPLRVRCD